MRFIGSATPDRVLAMYAETLQLIEARHLSPPAPQAMIEQGVANLFEALHNPAFLQANRLAPAPQQAQMFAQRLAGQLRQTPVRTSEEAVSALQAAMRFAAEQLPLSPVAVGIEFEYGAVESLDRYSAFVPPETTLVTTQPLSMAPRNIAHQSVSDVQLLDPSAGVAYMKLETFAASSASEMQQALRTLDQQGMRSLILDLRGDPGGLLTTAVEVADLFLPEGTIVSTRGRTPSDNTRETAAFPETWKVPLTLLVDENSASASEILAAAIQENGRGAIVGRRTYGKGTVQTLFPLQSISAGLRLTTARFYAPSGREMAGAGVEPDVPVAASSAGREDDLWSDRDIQAALRVAVGADRSGFELSLRGGARVPHRGQPFPDGGR